MKLRPLLVPAIGLSFSAAAIAAPFSPFDVRAAGMGGTGVASSKAASAALFNPAMLSAQVEGDRFQFVLGAGIGAADEAEMFDTIDSLQQEIENFDNAASNAARRAAAVGIRDALTEIDNRYLLVDLGGGLGVGVPGRELGVGVFATAKVQTLVTPSVAAGDLAFLNSVIASNGVPQGAFPGQSRATGVAVAVGEAGVALSHRMSGGNGMLDIGITPKMIEVSTFEYTQTVDDFDDADIDSGSYETTDSGFDTDIGLVYKPGAESPWQFGLVAKNLIGGDYKTVANRNIPLDTQWRAGVARTTDKMTIALDLDLVENDGVAPGAESQFIALGAEYDLSIVQLRAGIRANLADSAVDDAASVGLGLGPLDVSVMGNADEVGAHLQLGFGW